MGWLRFVFDYLKYFLMFFFFLAVLVTTGNVTAFLRKAQKSLGEIFTPLGVIVLIVLGLIMWIIYDGLKGIGG